MQAHSLLPSVLLVGLLAGLRAEEPALEPPDVVVLDVAMPVLNGIDAAREITRAAPHPHVILLSGLDDPRFVPEALRMGVRGFVPAAEFFGSLSRRRFPTTLGIRPRAQLEYLPEPDIFHDVFGHVPLHSHTVFADFLEQFGAMAAGARSEQETTEMARLFWFTVEFGLIHERGQVRIYGSGLISSHGDAANALGSRCARRPFDLDAVLAQPFAMRWRRSGSVEGTETQLLRAARAQVTRRRHDFRAGRRRGVIAERWIGVAVVEKA